MKEFKMGSLDHMHLMVPDRFAAARWYKETLGFEIVEQFRAWSEIEGGPLHISADGGKSGLALFEIGQHPVFKVETSVAFSVSADQFLVFAELLNAKNLTGYNNEPVKPESVVDHDMCYAYYFDDPYGNHFELDCYEYDQIKHKLIEKKGIKPVRFW